MLSTWSSTAITCSIPIPWIASPPTTTSKLCGRTRTVGCSGGPTTVCWRSKVLYFVNPLIYRVEIDPIASVLGFQGTLLDTAIEVGGHEDRHWDNVLQVRGGSTIPAVQFLRRRETHQCRLVSYNRRRMRYLLAVRMLGYVDGKGWTFLEPGA